MSREVGERQPVASLDRVVLQLQLQPDGVATAVVALDDVPLAARPVDIVGGRTRQRGEEQQAVERPYVDDDRPSRRDRPTLVKAGAVQGSLFLHPDAPRSKTLMASIDSLNRRYGRGAVAYGTATGTKSWTLRAEHLSARYTTRWGDLLSV